MREIIFIVVGALAWAAAAVQWRRVNGFMNRAVEVKAKIVRLEGRVPGQPPGSDGKVKPRDIVVPVVSFADGSGEHHKVRTRLGMRHEDAQGRRELTVFYDPDRPEAVQLSPAAERGQALLLIVMGLVVIALGVAGLVR